MTAKPTFRDGLHPSQEGAIVENIEIDRQTIGQLEKLLNCQLKPEQVSVIQGFVEFHKAMCDAIEPVSSQEVVVTLKTLAKLSDDRIQEAFSNCDSATHSLMILALYRIGYRSLGPFSICLPARLREAAQQALDGLPKSIAGRRLKDRRRAFLSAIPSLWVWLSGREGSAWTRGPGHSSPMLEFAALLLQFVEATWRNIDLETRDLSGLVKQMQEATGSRPSSDAVP